MSDTAILTIVLVTLALATYTVRVLIYGTGKGPPSAADRQRYAALMVAAAMLGVTVVGWVDSWPRSPFGVVAGLAVVEIGGAILVASKVVVRRASDVIGRRVGREDDASPEPRGDSPPPSQDDP